MHIIFSKIWLRKHDPLTPFPKNEPKNLKDFCPMYYKNSQGRNPSNFRVIFWKLMIGEKKTYPKDCSTALIKQVLPRFRNPTKFLRASFFLIAELLLLFGPVDDLKLFLLLFPFPLVPSLLFRDFLIAGWFSTPLKKITK